MAQKRKLLDRMRDTIRLKNYPYRTEKAYIHWVKRYIFFHQKRHPEEMGRDEIEAFLVHLAVDGNVAASTLYNPIYSHGYIQPGDERPKFNHGLFYSILCYDEMPFIDQAALAQLAGGEAWYEEAYAESPYLEVCQRWGVQGDDDSQAGTAVTTDIPTLFLIGRFNPFSPRLLVEEAASTFSRGYVVEFPNLTYNVLPFDCPQMLRSAWINNPDSPPDTTCVDNLPPVRFVTD